MTESSSEDIDLIMDDDKKKKNKKRKSDSSFDFEAAKEAQQEASNSDSVKCYILKFISNVY